VPKSNGEMPYDGPTLIGDVSENRIKNVESLRVSTTEALVVAGAAVPCWTELK